MCLSVKALVAWIESHKRILPPSALSGMLQRTDALVNVQNVESKGQLNPEGSEE